MADQTLLPTPLVSGGLAISASHDALARARASLELVEAWRDIALHALGVRDITKVGDVLRGNRGAASKIFAAVGGKLEILRTPDGQALMDVRTFDHPTRTRVSIVTAWYRYTRPDGAVFEAPGSFSSADPFFGMNKGEEVSWNDVNLADIFAAAATEAQKKSILRALGLDSGWSDEEAAEMGKAAATGHDFRGSKKITDDDPVIGWGNSKGERVSTLSLKDVMYYLPKYQDSVKDPSKQKWVQANTATAAALTRRLAQLKGESAPAATETKADEETGADASPETPPAAEPAAIPDTRGGKIAACFAILEKHGGKTGKAQAGLLRQITGAWGREATGTLSELNDNELRALLEMTEEQITTIKSVA